MSADFYSLSTLKDLLFHVQEHRFTLPEIENVLQQLNLEFCGFDSNQITSEFKQSSKTNIDLYDLKKWNEFELANPWTFVGMYQFWCQKSV